MLTEAQRNYDYAYDTTYDWMYKEKLCPECEWPLESDGRCNVCDSERRQ